MSTREAIHQERLAKWESIIEECRRSGEAVNRWCTARGIVPKTYRRWEKELDGRDAGIVTASGKREKSPPVFAEVKVNEKKAEDSQPVAVVRIGSWELELYSGVDGIQIEALLRGLKNA